MSNSISVLDCTLRDGAYVNGSMFGDIAIKGVISKLQQANIEYIECGWLKDSAHKDGSTYFHEPKDIARYIDYKKNDCVYLAMIDWDRYDLTNLPEYDGSSIDAIRVVFPRGKAKEGFSVAKQIRSKGYKVFLQAANTLAYSNEDLNELINLANEFKPVVLSVVDTFGAMYTEDLERIVRYLDSSIDPTIKLGFHSHNNQQLSFSLSIAFIDLLLKSRRDIVVDSSLCGMGRGAGNTTTELLCNYINRKKFNNYDMNCILDSIDMYIDDCKQNCQWGYSTPTFIAGMYQCHVNNIAYLIDKHRITSHDLRNIIEALSPDERRKYDYSLIESLFIENQSHKINDSKDYLLLNKIFNNQKILLLAPGKSISTYEDFIKNKIKEENLLVVGVNAINPDFNYDFLFFANKNRYDYARNAFTSIFNKTKKIILSNIKQINQQENEFLINFENVIKRGWLHFDNAVICALRLMCNLSVDKIYLAGFDGFDGNFIDNYSDENIPEIANVPSFKDLNLEITEMFKDVKSSANMKIKFEFLTPSKFDC